MRLFLLFLSIFISITTHAKLLQVSSVLWDFGQEKEVQVTGVGSLIRVDQRFFVLTAGHVSSGDYLKIQTETGAPLQIVDLWQDPVSDLSLIEVSPEIPDRTNYLLAAWGRHPDLKSPALVTDLHGTSDRSGAPYMINMRTFVKYPSHHLGFGSHIGQAPSYKDVVYRSPQILLAPWLKHLKSLEWAHLIGRHGFEFEGPSRKSNATSYGIPIPFANGYSGSPILVHHGSTMQSVISLYTLSGILTLANPATSKSHAAGAGALELLINQARVKKRSSDSSVYWFLSDDIFAQVNNNGILVFAAQGPVGNGIAPIGRTASNAEVRTWHSEQFSGRLSIQKKSIAEIEKAKAELSAFTREVKAKNGKFQLERIREQLKNQNSIVEVK